MKIGIYGRTITGHDLPHILNIFSLLKETKIPFSVEERYSHLLSQNGFSDIPLTYSDSNQLLEQNISVLISLGGDGTLLDTLSYVGRTLIPVLGINLGRLGFLSNIPKEKSAEAIYGLMNGHFRIDKRTLLELKSSEEIFRPFNFALNDFTIHKRDTGSMISVDTYLNGEFFSTYWADGVIVATPTGSTGYSLSCGGPIVFPDSANLVLTPVAPHNLNIRPIILSDNTVISFRVSGRGANHLISLDSRHKIMEYSREIAIQKAGFFLNLIKLNNQNFINTLREKLKWGLDDRNV